MEFAVGPAIRAEIRRPHEGCSQQVSPALVAPSMAQPQDISFRAVGPTYNHARGAFSCRALAPMVSPLVGVPGVCLGMLRGLDLGRAFTGRFFIRPLWKLEECPGSCPCFSPSFSCPCLCSLKPWLSVSCLGEGLSAKVPG